MIYLHLDKPQRWKQDIAQSVDYFNRWFITFAPEAFPAAREGTIERAQQTLQICEEQVREQYPALWAYLQTAPAELRQRYLVRQRTPWYRQERRDPAPFLCTYMGAAQTASHLST
ncbi:hypothetical protein [Chloroflexus sp.]|uniref:hypothetical protein n=1 Tax=Chloroflexus sp. TaxID=1904827 RepID=UPI002ACDAC5E|nr:hypothetical protein [Chloroflexus sp.]